VVASCPECRAIFYKIQESSERCAPLDKSQVEGGKAKPLPIKYCLVQDKQVIRCEFNTIDACYAAVDTGGSQQSKIIEVLQTASQQKLLSDVQMLQFATMEQETSPHTCQLDLSVESGRQYMNTPLNATFNIEQQRATIYLDRNFMSEQYLCVYGQDLRDETRFYTAGRPQLIKIDTVPPTANIQFAPLTRKLTFSCTDDKSGCKQTYWIQYISDITKFLPALMNGGGQSAAVWCPSYATANNWRLETKREVVYTANEVRVLCLRVEDNAGNAGVTKSMVYNGYDLLQTLITEYSERQ
jgi:hypothetical protein